MGRDGDNRAVIIFFFHLFLFGCVLFVQEFFFLSLEKKSSLFELTIKKKRRRRREKKILNDCTSYCSCRSKQTWKIFLFSTKKKVNKKNIKTSPEKNKCHRQHRQLSSWVEVGNIYIIHTNNIYLRHDQRDGDQYPNGRNIT